MHVPLFLCLPFLYLFFFILFILTYSNFFLFFFFTPFVRSFFLSFFFSFFLSFFLPFSPSFSFSGACYACKLDACPPFLIFFTLHSRQHSVWQMQRRLLASRSIVPAMQQRCQRRILGFVCSSWHASCGCCCIYERIHGSHGQEKHLPLLCADAACDFGAHFIMVGSSVVFFLFRAQKTVFLIVVTAVLVASLSPCIVIRHHHHHHPHRFYFSFNFSFF